MPNYLTKEQIESFLSAIKRGTNKSEGSKDRDYAMFWCMIIYGLRASEVKTITTQSFNKDYSIIKLQGIKNGLRSEYPVTPPLRKAIKKWIDRLPPDFEGPIFLSQKGKGISRQRLDQLMKEYGIKAGIPFEQCYSHILRHTCGTQLHLAGLSLMDIRQWLRHRDVKSTAVYITVDNERMKENSKKFMQFMGLEKAVNINWS